MDCIQSRQVPSKIIQVEDRTVVGLTLRLIVGKYVVKMEGTSALFAVSGFGVSGVGFSDMTAIVVFGLTSCALVEDSVGTVRAFYGKTRLLQMQNTVICGFGSGNA